MINFMYYLQIRNKLKPKKQKELAYFFKSNPETQELNQKYNGSEF